MKLREKFKRFWTLDVHNHEGFTLVELIIVIAILAILSGVAVAGYSAYIKKANMQADKTMIAEIKNAIQLAYYAESGFQPGVIILSMDAAPVIPEGNTFLENAMKSAYGDNLANLRLKYKWENSASSEFADAYLNSSFNGNEESLLNEVGKLTNLLADAIANNSSLVGSGFNGFLEDGGLEDADNQTKANAAVMYAADITLKADKDAFNAAFDSFYSSILSGRTPNVGQLTGDLVAATGSTFGACAAVYAHAEAFCQFAASKGETDLLNDFHESTMDIQGADQAAILATVGQAFQDVVDSAMTTTCAGEYAAGAYKNDVAAYLASMQAINDNSSAFEDRLGQEDCFTDGTAAALLNGYIAASIASVQDGQVAVVVTVKNGMLEIIGVPTDY